MSRGGSTEEKSSKAAGSQNEAMRAVLSPHMPKDGHEPTRKAKKGTQATRRGVAGENYLSDRRRTPIKRANSSKVGCVAARERQDSR